MGQPLTAAGCLSAWTGRAASQCRSWRGDCCAVHAGYRLPTGRLLAGRCQPQLLPPLPLPRAPACRQPRWPEKNQVVRKGGPPGAPPLVSRLGPPTPGPCLVSRWRGRLLEAALQGFISLFSGKSGAPGAEAAPLHQHTARGGGCGKGRRHVYRLQCTKARRQEPRAGGAASTGGVEERCRVRNPRYPPQARAFGMASREFREVDVPLLFAPPPLLEHGIAQKVQHCRLTTFALRASACRGPIVAVPLGQLKVSDAGPAAADNPMAARRRVWVGL